MCIRDSNYIASRSNFVSAGLIEHAVRRQIRLNRNVMVHCFSTRRPSRTNLTPNPSRPCARPHELTQQQLAEQLGIAQQTLAHSEGARLRLPVSLLPELTRTLGLSSDELLAQDVARHGKRGPSSKLQQQIEAISQLSKARQRFVSEMLDTVLAQTQQ